MDRLFLVTDYPSKCDTMVYLLQVNHYVFYYYFISNVQLYSAKVIVLDSVILRMDDSCMRDIPNAKV